MEQVNCSDRATLSEGGEWTASVWIDGDATNTFHADRRGLVYTVIGTTTKDSDMSQFQALLHGEEERVSADRGYDYPSVHEHLRGQEEVDWITLKAAPGKALDAAKKGFNRAIARIRVIAEHPFRILKRQLGYTKVHYWGLVKNTGQIMILFALSNPLSGQVGIINVTGVIRPECQN